jgi:hypothetical protein
MKVLIVLPARTGSKAIRRTGRVARLFANHARAREAVADVVASRLKPSAGKPRVTAAERSNAGGA